MSSSIRYNIKYRCDKKLIRLYPNICKRGFSHNLRLPATCAKLFLLLQNHSEHFVLPERFSYKQKFNILCSGPLSFHIFFV